MGVESHALPGLTQAGRPCSRHSALQRCNPQPRDAPPPPLCSSMPLTHLVHPAVADEVFCWLPLEALPVVQPQQHNLATQEAGDMAEQLKCHVGTHLQGSRGQGGHVL